MKKIAVFGSTGSIGTQTLSVAGFHPDEFEVYAIAANKNAEQVVRSANEFHPKFIGMYDEAAAREVSERCPGITVVSGGEVNSLAALSEVDIVVNGVSGFAGLFPLLSALRAGKTVALANKESIVCGHVVVNRALAEFGGRILPVDSEQSAIFQCLAAGRKEDVRSLILTASGGMFRNASADELARVTPQMALRHPTWSMGGKITIDSSTLFNKGLELMEAGWLFDIEPNRIEILIHPQSVVHSMVEFCDGAVFAQMSPPDMRLAIQYALTYPARCPSPVEPLSFAGLTLGFETPDTDTFFLLRAAREAFDRGGNACAALNGANEAAVAAFLAGRLGYLELFGLVARAADEVPYIAEPSLEDILETDRAARAYVNGGCI